MFPLHPPEQPKALSSIVCELPTQEMRLLYHPKDMIPFEGLKWETSIPRWDGSEASRGRLAREAGETAWNEGMEFGSLGELCR